MFCVWKALKTVGVYNIQKIVDEEEMISSLIIKQSFSQKWAGHQVLYKYEVLLCSDIDKE
jgi:hypothetical protein